MQHSSSTDLIKYTTVNLRSLQELAKFFVQQNLDSYGTTIGAHIRHIIEHYEALVLRNSIQVNYDARQRDEILESDPQTAMDRIEKLVKFLKRLSPESIQDVLEISCAGGSLGEHLFTYPSNFGRELCFLNSHCVHHLAIIRPCCERLDIPLNDYFGYAPSTIAFLESQKLEV